MRSHDLNRLLDKRHYQETGLHATSEEVFAWIDSWVRRTNCPKPKCHVYMFPIESGGDVVVILRMKRQREHAFCTVQQRHQGEKFSFGLNFDVCHQ